MPTISVIVPVYNVESYLNRCVDSILEQTFTDFDLILVDDGSPDNCPAICDKYTEKDSRIHAIHQKNGGLSAARNAGIDWAFENSDSLWLTFIDSDDWIHPEYLCSLLNAAMDNNVSVSICGYLRTDDRNLGIKVNNLTAILCTPERFFVDKIENATVAWGKLYRKSCFRTLRYPVGKLHEDEFITYKILFSFSLIAFISAPLYYYYQNKSSIMGMKWSPKRLEAFEAYDEQLLFFERLGNYTVLRKRIKSDLIVAQMQLQEIRKLSKQEQKKYKYAFCYLRKRMKKIMIKYHFLRIVDWPSDAWLVEEAFPVVMQFYWWIHQIIHKG